MKFIRGYRTTAKGQFVNRIGRNLSSDWDMNNADWSPLFFVIKLCLTVMLIFVVLMLLFK